MALTFEQHNDPLTQDVFTTEILSGFIEVRSEKYFQLDYSQYIQLIRASYNAVAKDDFPEFVSFSAYQYYCVFLLWRRLYFILSHRGMKVAETAKLDELVDTVLSVPPEIYLYLQGIGDLKDMHGNTFHIDIQATLSDLSIAGAQGSYGAINVNNYIDYETLPSLLISLLKIHADIVKDTGTCWDLPIELRPSAGNAVHPTRNLLGWWPAEALTPEQAQFIVITRIYVDRIYCKCNFNIQNVGYLPINKSLISAIASMIRSFKHTYDKMPSSRYGSVAQIPFITRSSEDIQIDQTKNIAGKLGCTNSSIQILGAIPNAAATFRYRIKRRDYNSSDMVAYKFINDDIPNEILNNENKIFEYGIAESWNKSFFRISEQNGSELINSLVTKIRMNVN